MGEKKIRRKYLSLEEFRAEFCNWSLDTFKRRVKNEGFPAIKDGGEWRIPADEADLWFKRRKVVS